MSSAVLLRTPPWPAWCLLSGGIAMVGLWLVFTASHGPTSFNENNLIAGRDMHFWGLLLGVVPNILVVSGLIGLRKALVGGASRLAVVGYVAAVLALAASAALDLYSGALAPPIFLPVVGAGLLLFGLTPRASDGPMRRWDVARVMSAIGIVLLVAFVIAWIPVDVTDGFGGFRIYGALAHLAAGVGWVAVGGLVLGGGRVERA
ncbi:MAG TPA: hypothetical protein VFN76_00840 [Candidatus Limnocylindria bacterium]|nr:hypothetical protein [Candidatus Limnocylindria bacterium]